MLDKKLSLVFLGGCEFVYLIQELKNHLPFDYKYSFEHTGEVDPLRAIENENLITDKTDLIIVSQREVIAKDLAKLQFGEIKSVEGQRELIKGYVTQLKKIIDKSDGKKIIIYFSPAPRGDVLNRFQKSRNYLSTSQFLRKYLEELENLCMDNPNLFIFNIDPVCSRYGYCNTFRWGYDLPWYPHIEHPAKEVTKEFIYHLEYILKTKDKVKCVLVDLDNTMWEGILLEDGIENLKIRTFNWGVLRVLHSRGILIGIISKNNKSSTKAVKEFIGPNHRGINYICFTLNWKDKPENVLDLQKELNIGMGSIAFIDDSLFEREQMKQTIPEIKVYDENIFEELLYLPEFQPEVVTKESKNRAKSYQQEKERKKFKKTLSRLDFLKQCNLLVKIEEMRSYEVDRVYELIQRTNQLNNSAHHYSRKDIVNMQKDNSKKINVIYASDKFGDYGLIGVIITEFKKNSLIMDSFLFSCRIMGKGVEQYSIVRIIRKCQGQFDNIIIPFKKTEKNGPIQKIIEEFGFKQEGINYILKKENMISTLPVWINQDNPDDM